MEVDVTDSTGEIGDALLAAFDDITAFVGERRLYALALVTDESAMSVGLAAGTEEAFLAHLAAERQNGEELTPQDKAWYRWSVGEWPHEGWRDDLFAGVNRRLTEEALSGSGDDARLARLIEAMTAALVRLRAARPAALAETVLFATLTDSDEAESIENLSARRTNPPVLRDRFLSRYE